MVPFAPSVAEVISIACELEKGHLVSTISEELNSIVTDLSLLKLSGTATIPDPPDDRVLEEGKWYGVLGSGAAKGNFEGEFSAVWPH
jgi:hypothetical protein